jgi:hypothetical protein
MGVIMRGDDAICGSLFNYVDLEKRIRADHPLRVIRAIANTALKSLAGEFQNLYSPLGRESIPPERLMRALLLQAFYSICSERQLAARRFFRIPARARMTAARALLTRLPGALPGMCWSLGNSTGWTARRSIWSGWWRN